MAEAYLRDQRMPAENWDGLRFGWGENVDTMWKSVWLEIERRDGNWVVIKIDRNDEELPDDRVGFHALIEA